MRAPGKPLITQPSWRLASGRSRLTVSVRRHEHRFSGELTQQSTVFTRTADVRCTCVSRGARYLGAAALAPIVYVPVAFLHITTAGLSVDSIAVPAIPAVAVGLLPVILVRVGRSAPGRRKDRGR